MNGSTSAGSQAAAIDAAQDECGPARKVGIAVLGDMQGDRTLNLRQHRDAGWRMTSGAAGEFLTNWVLQAQQIVDLLDTVLDPGVSRDAR
jgi:hypothetical protein